MNVAFCLYGQPRYYKEVLPVWEQIIKELDGDVFMHTWYGQERTTDIIVVDEVIDSFKPKEIQISSPHRFVDIIPSDATYENQSFHAMQQAYTISNSVQMMIAYENNLKKEYDVVVRSRMDIELLNPKELIDFITSFSDQNNLFVSSNSWTGNVMFDDNIMIGSGSLIKQVFTNYFDFTIEFIKQNKMIPGGEQNIFRYISALGLLDNIVRISPLDFRLLYMGPKGTFIWNQNE